ncbi:hypothetical protein F5Y03DRAFT_91872 [Xylaria venustula]|nr:hypothetical protein F5Y03DRAFT_91872 [Xylaria venustula]
MMAVSEEVTQIEIETGTDTETFFITQTAHPTGNESSNHSSPTSAASPSTSTTLVSATSDIGPPEQQPPPQTGTPALTTIFTPRPSCTGRYYVQSKSGVFYTQWGISSGTSDRLYRGCQPNEDASNDYYSPGACPANMHVATVSSIFEVTDIVTYTDICCQSGFVWDFTECYSIVSTTTTVLIAPDVSSEDIFIPVSDVAAWHHPILAVWQTTDLSLFPPQVISQKSSIVEFGWATSSTSLATSTPSESSPPSSEQNNASKGTPLGPGVIVGIAFGAFASVCFCVVIICSYRRRRRRQQIMCRESDAVLADPQRVWPGNERRAEMSSPTTSQIPGHEKQAPIELDATSAISPRDEPQSQRCESIVSPISDRVVSLDRAP